MATKDKEREADLTPDRMEFAKNALAKKGYDIIEETEVHIRFRLDGNIITHFVYTGWHTGKGITDGRGIHKLLKQLPKI